MKTSSNWFSVYVDKTIDTNTPFYVGKGNFARTFCLKRNKHHQNVVSKHGLKREIVLVTSVESIALEHEIELISELHTYVDDKNYNCIGCNHTPGGEGHVPASFDKERRSNHAKQRWSDPEKRKIWRASMKIDRKRFRSSSWRAKKSEAMKGEGNNNYGMPMPLERREKLSKSKTGKPSFFKGKENPHIMKRVIVQCVSGTEIEFKSFKHASIYISAELGLSFGTVKNQLTKRRTEFRGFKFRYV